ncbi:MAG: hypothetical protein WA154_11200 [Moraxellaceae bacterium]
MPTIPNGLIPVTAPSGYSFAGPGGVTRTEVEGGSPRTALSYDRGQQSFSVALVCSIEEFRMWTLFYHHVIKKGAISFDMSLDSGMGVATHTVTMFPESYQANCTNGSTWIVTFQVSAESGAYAYDSEAAALVLEYYDAGVDLSLLLAALETFSTVDSDVLDF